MECGVDRQTPPRFDSVRTVCDTHLVSTPSKGAQQDPVAGLGVGQRNTVIGARETWPNTHITWTKWAEEVFPVWECRVSQLQCYLYRFQLILLVPSLPPVRSKQKILAVRKKIYSTAPADKKKERSGAQLNRIELKCNQRTNTVYLMFSDNGLMPGIGGRSNTWKHMGLNFLLSLSQY